MKKKIMIAALTCMGVLAIVSSPMYTKVAKASEPSWDSSNTTSLSSGKGEIGASNDGDNLYVYFNTKSAKLTVPLNFTVSYRSSSGAVSSKFTLKSGDVGTTDILNSSKKVVGTGTITDSGEILDATVNLDKAGLSPAVGTVVSVSGGTNAQSQSFGGTLAKTTISKAASTSTDSTTDSSSSQTAAGEAMSQSDSSASQSSTLANNNNVSGSLGITIDGQYDDWSDKTLTHVDIDGDNSVEVSLLSDDKNVYFYVKSTPKYFTTSDGFQGSGYDLTVGDKTYYISFGTPNLTKAGDSQQVSVDTYADSGANSTSGSAYVGLTNIQEESGNSTVTNTTWQLECSIPLSVFNVDSSTSGNDITLTNSNGWQTKVKDTGGSTGPAVIVASGFVIAGAAIVKNSRSKNKKRRGNK